jgi:ferritin-like metal-binding protein YciE
LEEGDEIISEYKKSPAINAAIISAAQKVEHYEIASYGTLHAWAELLGNDDAAQLIQEILDQEKEADRVLNECAVSKNNKEALEESELGAERTGRRTGQM